MSKILKNYLFEQGYEIIALPKERLNPLDLLIRKEKDLQEYDVSLLELFQPDVKGLPMVRRGTAPFSGGKLLETDATLGVDLLSGLFKLLNLGSNELTGSLGRNKDVIISYTYDDVTEHKVKRQALDDFLVSAIPIKEGFVRSKERLMNSELYVITSLLKSSSINVEFLKAVNIQGELSANIQQLAKLNTKIKQLSENQFSISFAEDKPLAFAYRAARIIYDKKKWLEFWQKESRFTIKDQKGMTLKAEEEFPIDALSTEGGLSYF